MLPVHRTTALWAGCARWRAFDKKSGKLPCQQQHGVGVPYSEIRTTFAPSFFFVLRNFRNKTFKIKKISEKGFYSTGRGAKQLSVHKWGTGVGTRKQVRGHLLHLGVPSVMQPEKQRTKSLDSVKTPSTEQFVFSKDTLMAEFKTLYSLEALPHT